MTFGLRNVHLMGLIDDKQKDELFATSDVAVNPMFSGAGSNLKLAEYFACGTQTVTTPFGARGYGIEDGVNGLLSSRDALADRTVELLGRDDLEAMAEKGYQKAQDYSWASIANQIEALCDAVQKNTCGQSWRNDQQYGEKCLSILLDHGAAPAGHHGLGLQTYECAKRYA